MHKIIDFANLRYQKINTEHVVICLTLNCLHLYDRLCLPSNWKSLRTFWPTSSQLIKSKACFFTFLRSFFMGHGHEFGQQLIF